MKAYVQLCIAECLGLDLQGPKRICNYSETSGNGKYDFKPVARIKMEIQL